MQRALALSIAVGLLCGVTLLSAGCKENRNEASGSSPPIILELRAFDSALAPRGTRPFIAGETVHLALTLSGGKAPYEVQVSTSTGDPRLATASATLPESSSADTTTGLQLDLGSEVASGSYALTIRVTDDEGKAATIASETFDVVGSDAPVHPAPEPPLHLRVVDVAGRARRTFFQGEAIAIRATLAIPQDIAIAIVASDERPFMPVQRYPASAIDIDLPLQVPRLARVGSYRVDMATEDDESSVAIAIVGEQYPPASTPVLSDFHIYGGPKLRIPQTAVLRRGEQLRVEAIVGGIQTQGKALVRLRTRAGKQVDVHEFAPILPADTDATARTLLSAPWTPRADLARGRHMLELEVEEGGEVSTLYREVVLQ